MKRIYFYDILRGIAIIVVIVIHTLALEWSSTFDLVDRTLAITPGILITFYVGTMGGIFHYMMGSVMAFTMYKKVVEQKTALNKLVISGIVKGIILLICHYIFRSVFSFNAGILYHFLKEGVWIKPTIYGVISTSTFATLGWTSIIVSCLLGILFRNEGYKKRKVNNIILIAIATPIIALSPIVRSTLAPIATDLINDGNIFRAVIFGYLSYDEFPLFPYAAYGFLGAILGIKLATLDKNKKKFSKIFLDLYALIWIIIGIIGLIIMGGIDAASYYDYDAVSLYRESYKQFTQIGVILIVTQHCIQWYDLVGPEKLTALNHRTRYIMQISDISLTIFLFEGITTILLHHVANFILPANWNNYMGVVVCFAIVNVFLWMIYANFLMKRQKQGPIERFLRFVIKLLSGTKVKKKKTEIEVPLIQKNIE